MRMFPMRRRLQVPLPHTSTQAPTWSLGTWHGKTRSKAGLSPFHKACFFADGQLILPTEEGVAATDATMYGPTEEINMGRDNNRRGSQFAEQGDIRHLAADQVTEAQLMLPETAGVGPEHKAMMAAIEADGRLKLLRLNRAVSEVIDERIAAAKASRARAEKAQERLYARVGAPRTLPTNWRQT